MLLTAVLGDIGFKKTMETFWKLWLVRQAEKTSCACKFTISHFAQVRCSHNWQVHRFESLALHSDPLALRISCFTEAYRYQ